MTIATPAIDKLSALECSPAYAQSALPYPTTTPGAINTAVTQDNIGSTICERGWPRTVRPPRQFTSEIKRRQR